MLFLFIIIISPPSGETFRRVYGFLVYTEKRMFHGTHSEINILFTSPQKGFGSKVKKNLTGCIISVVYFNDWFGFQNFPSHDKHKIWFWVSKLRTKRTRLSTIQCTYLQRYKICSILIIIIYYNRTVTVGTVMLCVVRKSHPNACSQEAMPSLLNCSQHHSVTRFRLKGSITHSVHQTT